MNRERIAALALAAVVVGFGSMPALAKDKPKPSLSLEPIVAPNLLAPVENARGRPLNYRLDPGANSAFGQRARLSVEVGDATVFAITGRLNRQPLSSGPLDPRDARALGLRRDTGKVYGGGVSHNFRGVDLSATYQYSKVTADQPRPDSEAWDNGPGKSHSLKATARIRFKP